MTDKELHKLKRAQLLQLMLEQSREIDRLRNQVDALKKELQDREIAIEEVGSIAEAAMVLHHVFEDAQKAADVYLENAERICREKAVAIGAETEWDAYLAQARTTRAKRFR